MFINSKEATVDCAADQEVAASTSTRVRRWLLSPFRVVLRITEYLAGPPVHEEISTLQEETEKWKQRAAALEVVLGEFRQDAGDLKTDRDRLKAYADKLKKERDEFSDRAAGLENARNELKYYTTRLEKERDQLRHQLASGRDGVRGIVQIAEVENEDYRVQKSTSCLNNVRDSVEMQAGTFALLNQDGDGSGYGWNLLSETQGYEQRSYSIFERAQKAVYDFATDQVLFCGVQRTSTGMQRSRLLRYNIRANKWTIEPVFLTSSDGSAYDTNALNPGAREMYVSSTSLSNTLQRMNLDNGTWSSMAQPDTIGFSPSEPSAEYFPERDELLWLQMKRLGAWKRSSDQWTLISPELSGLRWRSAIARYNPVFQCVLILGGADTDRRPPFFSHAVYKYDKNGVITRLKDSPPSIKIYTNTAIVTVDPVSGDFLFIQSLIGADTNDFGGDIEFWKYRVDTDTWTKLDASMIPAPEDWWAEKHPSGVVAVPVARYGVIIFMSAASGSKSKVYLYKHS